MKTLDHQESFIVSVHVLAVCRVVFVVYTLLVLFIIGSTSAYAQSTTCHTVRSGDTLTSIATRYGTTVSSIMRTNRISNANSIRVGQRLCFATSSTSVEVVVTVAPTNSSPRATVTPSPPEGTPSRVVPTPKVAPTQPATIYIVRRGDSLFRISRIYGVSVSQLMVYNGLTSATIYTGQNIRIPPR